MIVAKVANIIAIAIIARTLSAVNKARALLYGALLALQALVESSAFKLVSTLKHTSKHIAKPLCLLPHIIFGAFLFSACSLIDEFQIPHDNPNDPPVLEPTKFKILLLDTPQVKFYDFASFKYSKNVLNVELYKLGRVASQMSITKSEVCMQKQCTSKWIAARQFFGKVSYANLFDDILAARDIFNGEGKRVSNDGAFVQWFIKGGQEFYYERAKNKLLFKNLSLGITIGIEDYIPQKESQK